MLNISQILQGVCKLMSTVYKNGCESICRCVRILKRPADKTLECVYTVCVCVYPLCKEMAF